MEIDRMWDIIKRRDQRLFLIKEVRGKATSGGRFLKHVQMTCSSENVWSEDQEQSQDCG